MNKRIAINNPSTTIQGFTTTVVAKDLGPELTEFTITFVMKSSNVTGTVELTDAEANSLSATFRDIDISNSNLSKQNLRAEMFVDNTDNNTYISAQVILDAKLPRKSIN